MAYEVRIPEDLWEESVEGVLIAWLLDEGDEVEPGDAIAEVMVEKAQYEVEAPGSGRLRCLKQTDDTVRRGDVIALLE